MFSLELILENVHWKVFHVVLSVTTMLWNQSMQWWVAWSWDYGYYVTNVAIKFSC